MNENISKNKHMTADQRNEIFTMLENGDSVSKIASAIQKINLLFPKKSGT